MAYNFVAELPADASWPEWTDLCGAAADSPGVSLFPIPPKSSEELLGIGVSVRTSYAVPETWPALAALLTELRTKYGFTVYELYTGEVVTEANLADVRYRLLG